MFHKNKEQKQTMRQKRLAMRKFFLSTSSRIGLLSLMGVFVILNIIQITRISTTGYEKSDLEHTIQVLEQENKQLDFKISTYRSLGSIEERLQQMNMVRADQKEYVYLPGRIFAKK